MEMRLGIKDHKVIAAFVAQRPAEGHKLSTNGERLDGYWMGGRDIAEWKDGPRGMQIVLEYAGSGARQTVQRAVRHHAAPSMLADFDTVKHRRKMGYGK